MKNDTAASSADEEVNIGGKSGIKNDEMSFVCKE